MHLNTKNSLRFLKHLGDALFYPQAITVLKKLNRMHTRIMCYYN